MAGLSVYCMHLADEWPCVVLFPVGQQLLSSILLLLLLSVPQRWKFIMLFCRCSQCLHGHHSSLLLPRVLVSPGLCSYSSSSLGKHMMIVLLHNSIFKKKTFICYQKFKHSLITQQLQCRRCAVCPGFSHITGGNHSHTASLYCA